GGGRRGETRRIARDVAAGVTYAQLVEQTLGKRMPVIRGDGERVRVLRTKRARRHAAAVRQRSNRDEPVVELCETNEGAVAAGCPAMIEPRVPLILVIALDRGTPIVVRRARRRRKRVTLEQRQGDRIDAIRGDEVAGKRRARERAGR